MTRYCHACAAPLDMPDFKGPAENFCRYCTDESGKLKPKETVKQGIAEWFKSWQPGIDDQKALNRAELYMKSMPAWADD
jgi:hypothetical protein